MAATTTLLGLVTPTQGTLSGTWGDTVNYGISDYLDIAIAGTLSFAGDGAITLANTTGSSSGNAITSTTAQYMVIRITGTQTVTKVITGPSYSKLYMVDHAGATSAVTFKATGQSGVSIAVGEKAFVYYNGTDYVKAASSVVSALTGTLPVLNGGTGQTSYTNGQLLIGNTTGNTLTKTTLTAGSNITITNGSGAITIAASGGSAATPTALGTVYGNQTSGGGTPFLTALGYNAAVSTTGASIIAVGTEALFSNTTGTENVAVGRNALRTLISSDGSVAVGHEAGYTNTGVVTALGYLALRFNSTPLFNTAVGYTAMYTNSTGNFNTAVGRRAMYYNTIGNYNCAIGVDALSNNTSGATNTAMGYATLSTNTLGGNNTAIGYAALNANTDGSGNVAVGYAALVSNASGAYNVAVGQSALYNCTGSYNYALGFQALYTATTASSNCAFGYQALYTNTASACTAMGHASLQGNTSGANNTAIGHTALTSNTTGDNSVALGNEAGKAATTGGYNTFIGRAAGLTCTTGVSNTIVGGYAASNTLTTGSRNTYLGYGLTPSGAAVTEEIIIAGGGGGTGKGSSTGYINPATGGVYQGNNSATWSVASDRRLKKSIVDNNIGLEKITQIQVRNFEYRLPEEVTELPQNQAIEKVGVQLGVIAQELQVVLPDCIKTESTGVMTVNSDNLTWYMINAIKELKAELDAYKATHP